MGSGILLRYIYYTSRIRPVVNFPGSFVTHGKRQIFYLDKKCLLNCHNYYVETLLDKASAGLIACLPERSEASKKIYSSYLFDGFESKPTLFTATTE